MPRRLIALAACCFALPVCGTLTFVSSAAAQSTDVQSVADLLAAGNRAYEARNAPEALKNFQAVLATDPKNYDALWRIARTEVDLGEFDTSATEQKQYYQSAQAHAQLAVQINPSDAWGHFALGLALGRTALSLGVKERVKYATQVREQSLECLKLAPKHAGCLHIMGVWNAEVMRLSGFQRLVAKHFLGGQVFDEASWPNARKYLEDAVNQEPRRIVHRLDLGRVYADMGLKPQAKSQFQIAIDGPLIDYNDPQYKQQAEQALKKL